MAECPICATEYQEGSIEICGNCGFDLTPFPLILGEVPPFFFEREETQIASVKQMWVKWQNEAQKQKQTIAQLEKLNQTQKEQLTGLKQENIQLKEENQTQNRQVNDLKEKYQQLREENERLKEENKPKTFSFEVVTVDSTGKINSRRQQTAKYFTEDLGNGVTLDMVYIPAGSFMMGTDDAEIARLCKEYRGDWFKREAPQHRVTLNAFYMAKYPITQAQYQAITGSNPSRFKGNNNPVELISWDMAQKFCQKLSQKTGRKYQLPSESQWEYACRAGGTTKYYFGDDDNQLGDHAWYSQNSNSQTYAVGEKKPNQWGLYDMLGNVWEWCEDDYADNYQNTPTDGTFYINPSIKYKCLRGGSSFNLMAICRCANRNGNARANINDYYGFRIVCIVSSAT